MSECCDIMYIHCNLSHPYKANGKSTNQVRFLQKMSNLRNKGLPFIYIPIGKTQQIFKKQMAGHFPVVLRISKIDKNMTHFVPIPNSSLNLLFRAYTNVSL